MMYEVIQIEHPGLGWMTECGVGLVILLAETT